MATVNFTENLKRHIDCPTLTAQGKTLQQVLSAIFKENPRLGNYVLDDQGHLRKHMTIAIDGKTLSDREGLTDKVEADSEIYIMQALSGG